MRYGVIDSILGRRFACSSFVGCMSPYVTFLTLSSALLSRPSTYSSLAWMSFFSLLCMLLILGPCFLSLFDPLILCYELSWTTFHCFTFCCIAFCTCTIGCSTVSPCTFCLISFCRFKLNWCTISQCTFSFIMVLGFEFCGEVLDNIFCRTAFFICTFSHVLSVGNPSCLLLLMLSTKSLTFAGDDINVGWSTNTVFWIPCFVHGYCTCWHLGAFIWSYLKGHQFNLRSSCHSLCSRVFHFRKIYVQTLSSMKQHWSMACSSVMFAFAMSFHRFCALVSF